MPDQGMGFEMGGERCTCSPPTSFTPGEPPALRSGLEDPLLRRPGGLAGASYTEVTDFDAHLRYMEGFHRRYMARTGSCGPGSPWPAASTSRPSRPSTAPCSGGKPMVQRFIGWCETLECGADLVEQVYTAPVQVER